jgi:glycerol-3-phosphate dehydrogenase
MLVAPKVAKVMAAELGRDEQWEKEQIKEFEKIASSYILR